MRVSAAYDIPRRRRSRNAAVVMDHFGVAFETRRRVIAAGLELPIADGDVVCFTGPSGSGKSSLLRAVAGQLNDPGRWPGLVEAALQAEEAGVGGGAALQAEMSG